MRYLATAAGTAHVVTKDSSCPIVRRNVESWKGQRSLKPNAVLEGYKDCGRCGTFEHARKELTPVNGKTRPTKPREKVARGAGTQHADVRTKEKADEHAKIAADYGWSVAITGNDHGGLTVTATKDGEQCVLTYREGGFLYNAGIVFKAAGGRVAALHNSGTWRRQVSLPAGKRPVSSAPKRSGRVARPKTTVIVAVDPSEQATGVAVVEEETININQSSLPFLKDDDDATIIDAIKGRTIYWRNNMMAKVVSARVPSKARMIRLGYTGRASRRCISFPEAEMTKDGEMYGGERSVAVDDLLRVRG